MQGWVDLGLVCSFTRVAHLFGHGPPEDGHASDAEVQQVIENSDSK